MADNLKDTLKDWTHGTVEMTGKVTQKAKEMTADAGVIISDKYKKSGLQDTIKDLGSWTNEQLDRSGLPAAAKSALENTTNVLDTVSGQKILELMEERNVLQDKYNDILATKLEEALRRIGALEKLIPKSRS